MALSTAHTSAKVAYLAKQGAPWSWKVMEKSWKMMIMSWNFYYCTELFCKSDTTSFIKLMDSLHDHCY